MMLTADASSWGAMTPSALAAEGKVRAHLHRAALTDVNRVFKN
jgi:hypothetical protein